MLGKQTRVVTFQMAQTSATQTFFVKMPTAIAGTSHVLIKRALLTLTVKAANTLLCAQLSKLTVDTAFSDCGSSAHLAKQLVHSKLSVGIAGKKIDQRFPSLGVIVLFHKFSFLL